MRGMTLEIVAARLACSCRERWLRGLRVPVSTADALVGQLAPTLTHQERRAVIFEYLPTECWREICSDTLTSGGTS